MYDDPSGDTEVCSTRLTRDTPGMKEKEARRQIIDGREIMLISLVPLCVVGGAWH